jgi:K+-transporting ATPase ATPase C chain
MWRQMRPAIRMTLVLTVFTGLAYPGLVTGLSQALFPWRANGSLVAVNGRIVGSELIGQNFSRPAYFQPRPSAAGADGYDASASNGSNLGPISHKLIDRITASIQKFRKENADFSGPLPADLVTTSASGLDPHISPASAEAEAPRIAAARGVPLAQIMELIRENTEGRTLGFLGEPRVNVLRLNLELDRRWPQK